MSVYKLGDKYFMVDTKNSLNCWYERVYLIQFIELTPVLSHLGTGSFAIHKTRHHGINEPLASTVVLYPSKKEWPWQNKLMSVLENSETTETMKSISTEDLYIRCNSFILNR